MPADITPVPPSTDNSLAPAETVSIPSAELMEFPRGTVALVANAIELSDDVVLPFAIADGITFDRATDDEVQKLKAVFPIILGSSTMLSIYQQYECVRNVLDIPGGGKILTLEELPREKWRYYVVRSDDNGQKNIDMTHVALVTQAWLDVGSIYLSALGHGWSPYALVNLYSMTEIKETSVVTMENLNECANVYALKQTTAGNQANPGPFPEIMRAFEMLNALRFLPTGSSFHVIGYFAILEMLITHNPKKEDIGDSITRQMKAKIPLLSNRFEWPLPYERFFGKTAHSAIWAKLYSYRSAYAHGEVPDFTRGDLVALRSEANANEFLKIVVQSIIRNSLREPQLYRDIKDC